MTGPEAEIRIRSIFAFDFRSPSGRGLNFPHYKDNEPEIDRPIWYYLDNRDHGTDTKVVPRFYLYPIPDKAYTVELYGNIIPSSLELILMSLVYPLILCGILCSLLLRLNFFRIPDTMVITKSYFSVWLKKREKDSGFWSHPKSIRVLFV